MPREKIHESDSARATAWAATHPERKKSYMVQYRNRNKVGSKKNHRKHQLAKYGLTEESYDKLMREQEGCCAICGSFLWTLLFVDHDHVTNKVRGLLCSTCNSGLGLLGDNIAGVLSALRYLKNAAKKR